MTDQDWTPREKRLMAKMCREFGRHFCGSTSRAYFNRHAEYLESEAAEAEASPREKPEAVDGALYVRRGVGYGTHFAPTTYTEADVRRLADWALTAQHAGDGSPPLYPFRALLDGEKK